MAVLKYAGKKKRDSPDLSDEEVNIFSIAVNAFSSLHVTFCTTEQEWEQLQYFENRIKNQFFFPIRECNNGVYKVKANIEIHDF